MKEDLLTQKDRVQLWEVTIKIQNSQFEELISNTLQGIEELIPFSGSMSYMRYNNKSSVKYVFRSNDITDNYIGIYERDYAPLDLIYRYMNVNKAEVIRGTSETSYSIMESSDFMKEWMTPQNFYYMAHMITFYRDIYYGGVFLYRSKNSSDFDDREITILNEINLQLSLRINQLRPNGLILSI